MRVAYVTTGGVGGGHIARGFAIARGFERAGAAIDYRVLTRPMPFPAASGAWLHGVEIDDAELLDPARAPASALARALVDFDPDLVLVDLFWASVRHILPLLRAEAWLLLRWHPPGWVHNPFVRTFDPAQYRRVVAIEPIANAKERVEPVVTTNPDELLPATALKERLGVDPARALHLVVQTGSPEEVDLLTADARARALPDEAILPMSLFRDGAIFPVAPWLAGADRITGGFGYNLSWELRWLGLASRATLHPFRRDIDDQALRARVAATYAMRENGADQLARLVLSG